MGSCCSKKKKKNNKSQSPQNHTRPFPLPAEEETVKEVLSETAKPSFPNIKPAPPQEVADRTDKKAHPIYINGGDEASEISEICSLSETISTTTITDNKKKLEDGEEEEEVSMRPRETGSYRRIRQGTGRREPTGRISPSKRSEPSPVRRMPVREGLVNRPWIPAGNHGVRRDLGDNSSRRSRSPAPRNDLSRSSSVRKTGRSPRKVPPVLLEEKAERGGVPTEKESLENPLVSLECFIFL